MFLIGNETAIGTDVSRSGSIRIDISSQLTSIGRSRFDVVLPEVNSVDIMAQIWPSEYLITNNWNQSVLYDSLVYLWIDSDEINTTIDYTSLISYQFTDSTFDFTEYSYDCVGFFSSASCETTPIKSDPPTIVCQC